MSAEKLFDQNKSYYNIPFQVNHICGAFIGNQEFNFVDQGEEDDNDNNQPNSVLSCSEECGISESFI